MKFFLSGVFLAFATERHDVMLSNRAFNMADVRRGETRAGSPAVLV